MPASGSPPTAILPRSPASPISTASICSPLPDRGCSSACSARSRTVPPAAPSCSPRHRHRCARWPVKGLLLPDLAFRLTAIRFAIPPLRQRREDIPPLAQSLLDRICARYQQRPVLLGPGALARLLQHNWPGNVRELASVLETALLEADNGVILAANLALPAEPEMQPNLQPTCHAPGDLTLDAVVRHHVQYVLDLNRGNKLRAARQLAISRSTLYRILGNESLL
jgi:DNA-binding NtrC family response regulator